MCPNHPDRRPFARGWCKPCYQKWWRTERRPLYYHHTNARVKYGLEPEQLDALLARGKCAICDKVPRKSKIRNLVVDHDHRTGKVRGVLCRNCNSALGWFERRRQQIEEYTK